MEENSVADSRPAQSRGRGKSRGGLGKFLRARGRRGGGRPAEFGKRLVLEGEEQEETDEEEIAAQVQKYARRQMGTNADRYVEEEPELGSDGEPVVEPEVDLTAFLARQRLQEDCTPNPSSVPPVDEAELADIDHSLSHIGSGTRVNPSSSNERKGNVQTIAWDQDLEDMRREKDTADAQRELRGRFRVKVHKDEAQLKTPRSLPSKKSNKSKVAEAPPLPGEVGPAEGSKEEMEGFLDDLLS